MLSDNALYLMSSLKEKEEEKKKDLLKPKLEFRTAVGALAFIYEKVRNLIDYQEERLLLRRAITRILTRRVKTDVNSKTLIGSLVNELLMAHYLPNNFLSENKVPEAEKILNKYFLLYRHINQKKVDKEDTLDFLLSLAGREIEELFVPSKEDLLINFGLKEIEKKISWLDGGGDEEVRTRILIALMRSLSKDEDRTIYFKLWKLYFPKWQRASESDVLEISKDFLEANTIILRFLQESCGEPLVRLLKKQIAPFEILRDLMNKDYSQIEEAFFSPEKLIKVTKDVTDNRYKRALSTLHRSAINSFVYIFITKMVLALAVEVPYELFVSKHINPVPIFINLFFPPSLMLFMSLTIESLTEENSKKIGREMVAMVFGGNETIPIKVNFTQERSKFFKYLFGLFYLLAFAITFGLTVFVLRKLHFSIVSLGVFFFFISTISFFAFRIRSSFKELVVGEENSNLVSTIFDFFMLPFIKLGRTVSTGLQEINLFTFIFDIVIEAPFKMLLEIIEELIGFLREKKEEALNVIK